MLDLQVLIITLMPLFSGVTPQEMTGPTPAVNLVGVSEPVNADFMIGRWKWLDQFSKWGITDKEKSRIILTDRTKAVMDINADGTFIMRHLFRPSKGRWELSQKGLLIYDPSATERAPQLIPVRKRDENRIWLLLPFAQGAIGIGMVRDDPPDKTGTDSE